MENEFDLDNILDDVDGLFGDSTSEDNPPAEETEEKKDEEENIITEVTPDNLFDGEPESVGNTEEINKGEENTPPKEKGTSPNTSIYSPIAKALKEEGIFPDLEEEAINNVDGPESFRDIIEQQIKANLDERQKRIDDLLEVGVEPSVIQKYENTLNTLDNISEDAINSEEANGETLRKQLIYQDYVNMGYSKERAAREVEKSLNAGTDIEDAKEALQNIKSFFKTQYDNVLLEAQEKEEEEQKHREEQVETLKKSIFEDKELFGDLSVDKTTRQRVFDNILKPTYKDPDTGEYYTAIQKYEKDNKIDFLKKVGLVFTMTNGFKNFDGLVKGKVKREMKKGLRELEATLSNTARTNDGNLRFMSSVIDDPSSYSGKGWDFDV